MSSLDSVSDEPKPPRWFLHAQTFERAGIIERPGIDSHPTILSFFNYTTLKGTKYAKSDETAWCSAFCCAMFEQVGIRGTKSAAAASWLGWGQEIDIPRLGCVVVTRRDVEHQHVSFYAGHINDKQFASLGGNQNNCVCTKPKAYADVLSYRWPVGEK